jgi:hypothetical protein
MHRRQVDQLILAVVHFVSSCPYVSSLQGRAGLPAGKVSAGVVAIAVEVGGDGSTMSGTAIAEGILKFVNHSEVGRAIVVAIGRDGDACGCSLTQSLCWNLGSTI